MIRSVALLLLSTLFQNSPDTSRRISAFLAEKGVDLRSFSKLLVSTNVGRDPKATASIEYEGTSAKTLNDTFMGDNQREACSWKYSNTTSASAASISR